MNTDEIEALMERLADKSAEKTASRVLAEINRKSIAASATDPWLTHDEAAAYLNCAPRTFDEMRVRIGEPLKPTFTNPLRWSKSALDVFKFSQGPALVRRGRKPNHAKQAA